jgi:hypothetical protein
MPFGLSTPEFAGIVGGLFSLWFSGQAYLRAGAAETRAKSAEDRATRAEAAAEVSKKQALELAVASELQMAKVDLRSIETSVDARLWALHKVRCDADIAKCPRTVAFCDAGTLVITRYRDSVSSSINQLVDPIDPKVATHQDLLLLRGKLNTYLKETRESQRNDDILANDNLLQLVQLLDNEKAGRLLSEA